MDKTFEINREAAYNLCNAYNVQTSGNPLSITVFNADGGFFYISGMESQVKLLADTLVESGAAWTHENRPAPLAVSWYNKKPLRAHSTLEKTIVVNGLDIPASVNVLKAAALRYGYVDPKVQKMAEETVPIHRPLSFRVVDYVVTQMRITSGERLRSTPQELVEKENRLAAKKALIKHYPSQVKLVEELFGELSQHTSPSRSHFSTEHSRRTKREPHSRRT